MKVMAIDYGDARTGIAVSDATGTIIGDAFVIAEQSQKALCVKITQEASARFVCRIVVGYPKNMDGSAGSRAEKSAAFAERLRAACNIEVVLWDERLTTVSAHQILSDVGRYGKKRKKAVDAVAASLILEGYLAGL